MLSDAGTDTFQFDLCVVFYCLLFYPTLCICPFSCLWNKRQMVCHFISFPKTTPKIDSLIQCCSCIHFKKKMLRIQKYDRIAMIKVHLKPGNELISNFKFQEWWLQMRINVS